ncbi:peptide deformylase [Corynebacterium striatum]|uniref:peptide deformylase n=1 Tax=Corynebacterium striatum TaxID=43770 RepID=UPI001A35ED7A|nr:peptide deformylase [Corynebacterium striatum]
MAIRAIRMYGDPVLTSRATEIEKFDSSLEALANDMLETMDAAGGVGLAANQIGLTKRIFVYDCSYFQTGLRGAIINPVWTPLGDKTQDGPEGCLSIPDITENTERYESVVVHGRDVRGNAISMVASGLMARCIQHETDHLDGVLFLQRLTPERHKEAMQVIRNSEWFNS